MSIARENFLQSMNGAYEATQDRLLLAPAGTDTSPIDLHKARLLRNGLAVTVFSSFEGFIRERLAEVSRWLTQQGLPASAFPAGLTNAARSRGLRVLNHLISRSADQSDIDKAFLELGESWSKERNGGGWVVPHVSLLWEGSNLSGQVSLDIMSSFGVNTEWKDLSAVSKGAGFQALPSKVLFDEIAQRRHSSAHQADYSADILLLRSTPNNLISFGFAFDALISATARSIVAALPPAKGRAAISPTILDQVNGSADEWEERQGWVDNPTAQLRRLSGKEELVVAECRAALRDPQDILVVRRWDGKMLQVKNWHTMGI